MNLAYFNLLSESCWSAKYGQSNKVEIFRWQTNYSDICGMIVFKLPLDCCTTYYNISVKSVHFLTHRLGLSVFSKRVLCEELLWNVWKNNCFTMNPSFRAIVHIDCFINHDIINSDFYWQHTYFTKDEAKKNRQISAEMANSLSVKRLDITNVCNFTQTITSEQTIFRAIEVSMLCVCGSRLACIYIGSRPVDSQQSLLFSMSLRWRRERVKKTASNVTQKRFI